MAQTSSAHVFLLTLLLISASIFEARALRCFHCAYFSPSTAELLGDEEGYNVTIRGPGAAIELPFATDPSCAFGNIPDPSISIDCAMHPHIIAATLSGIAHQLEELDIQIEGVLYEQANATYSCAAMAFFEKIEIDGVIHDVQSTYRSCYPDTRNLTEDLLAYKLMFGATNTSGYICDNEDNCNGKGDKKKDSAQGRNAVVSIGLVCILSFIQITSMLL